MNDKKQEPISELYEQFHSSRSSLKRIISENEFTHMLILPIINTLSFRSVLDLGCGSGNVCLYLANKGIRCLGVDISHKTISIANIDSEKFGLSDLARFVVGDVQKLSSKKKFDLILLLEVLEHVDDLNTLKNAKKLLKPGGRIVASSPSINAPLYKLGLLTSFDNRVGHLRRYSRDSFRSLFKEAGYEVEEVHPNEGILRNGVFNFNISFLVKLLNKFNWLARSFTVLDNITLKIFGESDIIIVARKKR